MTCSVLRTVVYPISRFRLSAGWIWRTVWGPFRQRTWSISSSEFEGIVLPPAISCLPETGRNRNIREGSYFASTMGVVYTDTSILRKVLPAFFSSRGTIDQLTGVLNESGVPLD